VRCGNCDEALFPMLGDCPVCGKVWPVPADQQSTVSQKCIYCAMDMEPVKDAAGAWWHDNEECWERSTDKPSDA
jgi:hypothetical protein